MRIKRLTIAGFGPYKGEQFVDFEEFRAEGLFLITGKTGAGKSSILDAVCYALYGTVPRYENLPQKLRSDHCAPDDPTFVQLDFTVSDSAGSSSSSSSSSGNTGGETEYRVRRTPEYERPKSRGTGTTVQKPTAELSRWVNGQWEGIAARPVDVGHELDRVLGLTKDQFLQVILLAQNRFQEFLLAKNDERQAVLRTLFGTRRFQEVEAALVERQKNLGVQLASGRQVIEQQATLAASLLEEESTPSSPGLAWFDVGLASLDQRAVAATAAEAKADTAFTEADAAHRTLVDTQKLQLRRDAAAAKLAALEGERPAIDSDRELLAAARRAALVWPQVLSRREAATALESTEATERLRRDEYRVVCAATQRGGASSSSTDRCADADADADYDVRANTQADTDAAADADTDAHAAADADTDVSSDALRASIDQVTRSLGTLESVLIDEKLLPGLAAEATRLQQHYDGCAAAVAQATEHIEVLPRQIDAITVQLASAQVRAAAEPGALERVDRLTTASDAAKTAVALEVEYAAAQILEMNASGENAAAANRVHELMQQRLNGYAAELASNLVDGEPCSVCGSKTHPAPTDVQRDDLTGATVTEAEVDRARLIADGRRTDFDASHAIVQGLGIRLLEARTRADNKAPEQLNEELAAARTALSNANVAAEESVALDSELSLLRTELDSARAGLAELRISQDLAAQQLAEQLSKQASVEERIEKYRGAYDTVSAHVEQLQEHLAAANALNDAILHSRATRKTLDSAFSALAAQLAEHDFSDEDAVSRSRHTVAEIDALESRIRSHDQADNTARSTLAEPEVAGLPEQPVETDAAAEALRLARAARDEALSARSSVAERRTQFERIVRAVQAQHAASARLQEEFEQIDGLARVVQGSDPNTKRMRLETYVLAAQLEEIVAAANTRLRAMSSGRYVLEHDDSLQYRKSHSGLGLSILDQHTGRTRATHSLSGGETFLASLALALGLAEVVTNQAGGITLDTLFIDEGFGSLDGDTLEIAMGTLDSLRAGGRTIGLISHVEAMKEQVPAKLHITVTDQGHSEIEIAVGSLDRR